jgi:hypothetical protein
MQGDKVMEKLDDRIQDRIGWIRDLVSAEEQMEESGLVDMGTGSSPEKTLIQESTRFLFQLKHDFVEAATAFNELKASPLGRIKIYGIAKTQADFMLFRNGFKMIFSMLNPGQISIRFNFIGPNYLPSQQIPSVHNTGSPGMMDEHILEAKTGAFGELIWSFEGQPIRLPTVVKYHMTLFIKESAK